jgi:hypothetical protein
MKKQQKIIISVIILIIVVIAVAIYFWQRPIRQTRQQVGNYQAYQAPVNEIDKVKRNEMDFIYYYAADGKRYVFPELSVFKSWFGDYPVDKLAFENVETMSQSPLGGNVTLRPGTLLQSPTLLNTFIVVKNGYISPVGDEEMLVEYYGPDWEKLVVILPDYYFSQYGLGKTIKSVSDFPKIPAEITIDQDKDFIN